MSEWSHSYVVPFLLSSLAGQVLGQTVALEAPSHQLHPVSGNFWFLITLWVLAAAGLPCLLSHVRAVSMRAYHELRHLQPWLLGTAGTRQGAVVAEGDSKKDSWVRGKDAPSGSVTAVCGAPGVSIRGTLSSETVFQEKHSR